MKKKVITILLLFVLSISNVYALNLTTKEEREAYEKYSNSRDGMIELEELIIPVIFITGCMIVCNIEINKEKSNAKYNKKNK